MHSLLALPVNNLFKGILKRESHTFTRVYNNVKPGQTRLIIIDEKSMISQYMLGMINMRLQNICRNNKPFGGMHVFLMGDFRQIAPVTGKPMYNVLEKAPDGSLTDSNRNAWIKWEAFRCYEMFNKVITLTTNHRMQTATPEGKALFRKIRDIGNGNVEKGKTFQFWKRFLDSDFRRKREFLTDDTPTTHLFWRNEDADQENADFLNRHSKKTGNALHVWYARSGGKGSKAEKKNSDFFGLRRMTALCEGTPVMLLTNEWVEAGLANGSTGILRKVVYAPGSTEYQIPMFCIVEFPDYSGPSFFKGDPVKAKWVPIIPFKAHGDTSRDYRENIPLACCYAMTIHKSQGQTLKKVYLRLPDVEQAGLTYVGLSRCVSARRLMIAHPAKEEEAFLRIPKSSGFKACKKALEKLDILEKSTRADPKFQFSDDDIRKLMDHDRHVRRNIHRYTKEDFAVSVTAEEAMRAAYFVRDVNQGAVADYSVADFMKSKYGRKVLKPRPLGINPAEPSNLNKWLSLGINCMRYVAGKNGLDPRGKKSEVAERLRGCNAVSFERAEKLFKKYSDLWSLTRRQLHSLAHSPKDLKISSPKRKLLHRVIQLRDSGKLKR